MLNKFNMLRFPTFVRNDISPYCDKVSGERGKGRWSLCFTDRNVVSEDLLQSIVPDLH